MSGKFHSSLNRMALFTALVLIGAILFRDDLMHVAASSIWLNGIIIGTTIFGIASCFVDTLRLVPEYRWMKKFFSGTAAAGDLPPAVLRPVAVMLARAKSQKKNYISAQTMNGFMNLIMGRFEDQRDQLRYITNVLIFMGLLGTFWGLIHTIGGFSDLISVLDFNDEGVMGTMQKNLAHPLAGMGVAFSSSLLGLAGSLIVGFLELQTTMAQNSLLRELEENMSERTRLFGYLEPGAKGEETALPYVNAAAKELTKAVEKLEKTVNRLGTRRN